MATKNETTDTAGGAPPAEGTEPAPKYVTADELHEGLAARMKPLEQKFEKWLNDTFTTTVTKLRAEFAQPKPPGAAGPPAPAEPKPEGKKREPENPELGRLQEQIANLTRQADEARSERDAERAKARDAALRQKTLDALGAGGVEGVRARHALGLLVDAEKRVRWLDDSDALAFRGPDGADVDILAGVRAWLKTEDGKFYLPARGVAGSGDRPGASAPSARAPGAAPDRSTVAEGLRRALIGEIAG